MKHTISTQRPLIYLSIALCLLFIIACSKGKAETQTQAPLLTDATGSPIHLPDNPSNVAIGDMNNDKKPDIVVSCGRSRSIIVLLGQGNGQFGPPASTTTLQDSPAEIALADLNGDRKLDIAVASHSSYGVVLLFGDGNGGFAIAPGSPVIMKVSDHPHTHWLAVADMNADNKLDLITVNNTDNDVSIALGDGRGGFKPAPKSPFGVGPSPYPGAIGDVNGDGYLDIVATATATGPLRAQQLPLSKALTLLLADKQGGFRSTQLPLRTSEPWFAVIEDVNGDRKPDIVATHHELNALTVLLGDGRGSFVEAPGSPFDFGHHLFHVAVADVNRDGKLDVVGAAGDGARVILGDGRGGFKSAVTTLPGQGVWRLAVGDLNGDGKLDVVTSNGESSSLGVYLGR